MESTEFNILVTGAAGFIGYHLIKLLLQNQFNIVGIDNLNNYYDVNLKYSEFFKLLYLKVVNI